MPVPGVDLILVTSFGPSLFEHSFARTYARSYSECNVANGVDFKYLEERPLLLDLLTGNDSVYLLYINSEC